MLALPARPRLALRHWFNSSMIPTPSRLRRTHVLRLSPPKYRPWSTAQTSTRDLLSLMARQRESHGQRLDSTATLTTNFNRRQLVLRTPIGDHQLILFLTALILTRDSLLLMERLKLFHTHKFTITASLTTKWVRS